MPSHPSLPLSLSSSLSLSLSQMPVFEILPLSVWHSELAVACRTLRRISGVAEATVEWLHSVGSALPLSERVPDTLPLLLTHAIVCHHGDVCRLALETVATLARADPTQVEQGMLGSAFGG